MLPDVASLFASSSTSIDAKETSAVLDAEARPRLGNVVAVVPAGRPAEVAGVVARETTGESALGEPLLAISFVVSAPALSADDGGTNLARVVGLRLGSPG